MADEVKHTPRDYLGELRAGGCKDGYGCNAATQCMCGLVEDAATEVVATRTLVQTLVGALAKVRGNAAYSMNFGTEYESLKEIRSACDAALSTARAQGFEV